MSDWNGPALYRIESGIKRNARVALSGGDPANGTKVLMWTNDQNHNDVFAITYAGVGKTGKHEYHIINNKSGTFLTYPDGAPNNQQLTGQVLSPSNVRTRWSIIPLRNGSGQYWITTVANSGKYLNVNSGKTDNGTEVWLYNDGQHPSCKWYLTLYENITLNCPDVGKGKRAANA